MVRLGFYLCGHFLDESFRWMANSVWPSVGTASFFSCHYPLFRGRGLFCSWGESSLLVPLVENLEGLGKSIITVVPFSSCYLQLWPVFGAHLSPSGWLTLLWVAIWSQFCFSWPCRNLGQSLGETEGWLGRYFGWAQGRRFTSVVEIYWGRCLPLPFLSICGECGCIVGFLPEHKPGIKNYPSAFG